MGLPDGAGAGLIARLAGQALRVPVILGARKEVERLARYHAEYDAGEDTPFRTPLFNARSLFRTA